MRRGGGVAAPVTAPGYLSAVVAPYAVYGAQRLVSGYSGALFRIRRSDTTELDISAATGGDYPDYAAIVTWAAGSALTVPTIYDQTGNGRHLTQATVANQPSFDPAAKTGNCAPILIDGYARTTGTGLPAVVAKTPTVTGLTLDVIANSAFIAAAPITTFNNGGFFEWQDSGAVTQQAMHYGGQTVTARTTGLNEATNTATNGIVPRTQLDVSGMAVNTTQSVIWANGAKRTIGHTKTTLAVDRIKFGASAAGGTGFNGTYKLFGAAFYNSTVSNANGDAIEASLKTAHGYSSAFPYRVVFAGDSIMEGSGSLLLKNMPAQMALTKNAELFNNAVHGQTLATEYGARVARFGSLYDAAKPCVVFLEGGTNDIFTAATAGATLYSATTAPFVTYLQGLGFKVVVCTILPQTNSTNYTAGKETERLAYNSLVVANSAAADLVLDIAANATMGDVNAPLDTAKYCDKIHPTTTGYGYLAPLYTAALQTVLRTTALGGSYVP
jgi:hypothetical protein